jgi:hypothetical protein
MGMARPKTQTKKPDTKDWYTHDTQKDIRRIEKMFHLSSVYEEEKLKEIPLSDDVEVKYNTVYVLKNKKWKLLGYKCHSCNRTMDTQELIKKHSIICSSNNKINTIEEDEMPVQVINKNGQRYYRWGTQGKLYKTKEEAERQGRAAYASGYRESVQTNNKSND